MGQSKYRRKPPKLIQKDTIYIVCGGETEKIYFNLFKKEFKNQLSGKKIKVLKNPLDPLNLIQHCIQIKEDNKNCLRMWAVFDKDEFDNFDESIKLAQKNNIMCAFSNQAFEVWFIYHFQELYAPLHRKNYSDKLEKLLGEKYEKNSKCLNKIVKGLFKKTENAIINAEKSHIKHIEDKKGKKYSDYESCTLVYKLVKDLLK